MRTFLFRTLGVFGRCVANAPPMRALRSLLPVALAATILVACGDDGPGPSGGTATIAGTVRNANTDEPIQAATVSVGTRQTTTDQNGSYALSGVTPGPSVTIRSERTEFAAYAADIAVTEGSNTHDIRMTQEVFVFGAYALYVPAGVAIVRGVILGLGGPDTRGFATGEFISIPSPSLEASLQAHGVQLRALASDHGLAILGTLEVALTDTAVSDQRLLGALEAAATASGRTELRDAPLLMYGISAGAPEALGLTLRRPERVAGVALRVPVRLSTVRSAAAQRVPAYLTLAEADTVADNEASIAVFKANRAENAIWALAVEPGAQHAELSGASRNLIIDWMVTTLELRLPLTPGAALIDIPETSGWLGNRTTFEIAPYASYAENKLEASWLPSQATAEAWRAFVTP